MTYNIPQISTVANVETEVRSGNPGTKGSFSCSDRGGGTTGESSNGAYEVDE
jgi:hypothetical protein